MRWLHDVLRMPAVTTRGRSASPVGTEALGGDTDSLVPNSRGVSPWHSWAPVAPCVTVSPSASATRGFRPGREARCGLNQSTHDASSGLLEAVGPLLHGQPK